MEIKSIKNIGNVEVCQVNRYCNMLKKNYDINVDESYIINFTKPNDKCIMNEISIQKIITSSSSCYSSQPSGSSTTMTSSSISPFGYSSQPTGSSMSMTSSSSTSGGFSYSSSTSHSWHSLKCYI